MNAADGLARVRANLAALPIQSRVFEHIFASLASRAHVAILAGGSLAAGGMDHLSELDIEVVVRDEDHADARAFVDEMLSSIDKPLCRFPADHLGLRDLIVSFHEIEGTVIKIDVWVMTRASLGAVAKAIIIHDPEGLAADRPPASAPPPLDYSDLNNKFCGWMWFTHVKLARGHLLEAMESLEFMRSFALLPSLHLVHRLPRERYRLLEERLSPARLEHLYRTYPRGMEREEIYRAMRELASLYASLQNDATCIDRMQQLIGLAQ